MTLTLTRKQEIVSELSVLAANSISAVVADYRGMTAVEMTTLRDSARKAGVKMRIYQNRLADRALADTQFSCLKEVLVGPNVFFFAQEEPGSAARILRDFLKRNDKLEVKALAMDGSLLPPSELAAIASLPSRDEALAKLMSQMMAPITQFVRTVNEPAAQLVRAVAAVRDQKEKSE